MRWDEILARLPSDRPIHGAEIGVWKGDLSAELLAAAPNLFLYLVDPWTKESQGRRLTGLCHPRTARRLVEQIAERYPARTQILPFPSVQAAKLVPDQSLDFAFIDARHTYQAVRADIAAWTPKIRRGGWLGGHDYHLQKYPGVCEAVDEAFGALATTGVDATWFAPASP